MTTFQGITPLLVYKDIRAAHDFLVEAFGFTSGGVERDDNGEVAHAEVRAGDAKVWLHQVSADSGLQSAQELPASSGGLVILVDDVDKHYERARAHGARTEGTPRDQPYGLREYGALDSEGHRWWFSSPLS